MTLIAVLDYGIGNLRSAQKALERVGADARLTDDPGLVRDAAGVVLPGVGAFGRCMEAFAQDQARPVACRRHRSRLPFLGICVGMQMLYADSQESPGVAGLGILDATVRLLPDGVKRPQMQWNILDLVERPSVMFDGLDDPAWVYFVHSYAPDDSANVVARCDYGGQVCGGAEKRNVGRRSSTPRSRAATDCTCCATSWPSPSARDPRTTAST